MTRIQQQPPCKRKYLQTRLSIVEAQQDIDAAGHAAYAKLQVLHHESHASRQHFIIGR